MTDKRMDCKMRHENGNCTVIGGFCTAVNDPICEGLRNAYDSGYRAALLDQQELENNAPLTLDELRKMDGEPVWIVWPDGRIKSRWWIVGNYDWNMMEFFDTPMRCQCGKTWIPYRHKTEERTT